MRLWFENLAFMYMVVRMVNIINEPGTFWVTNSFIWGWLLLPVLQLSELIKSDCSKNEENIKRNFRGYVGVTTIIVAIWIVTIPLWEPFIKNVLNMSNYGRYIPLGDDITTFLHPICI